MATPKKKPEDKKTAGRKTTYNPKYIKMVDKYLEANQDEIQERVKQANTEKGYEMYEEKLIVRLPTIGGFSLFIDVPERTVYEWKDIYPEFSQSLSKILKEQEARLLNNGLQGTYNPTIAKLVLSANHGYKEKTESEIKVKSLGALLDELEDE